jgi:hypothetical protein
MNISPSFASNLSSAANTASAAKNASSLAQLNKIQGTGTLIQVGGELIAMGITAAASIKDQKLRREFEQEMAKLNAQDQKILSEKVLQAETDNEKRKVIADTLIRLAEIRIKNLRNNTATFYYILGGLVILIGGYYLIKKIKK